MRKNKEDKGPELSPQEKKALGNWTRVGVNNKKSLWTDDPGTYHAMMRDLKTEKSNAVDVVCCLREAIRQAEDDEHREKILDVLHTVHSHYTGWTRDGIAILCGPNFLVAGKFATELQMAHYFQRQAQEKQAQQGRAREVADAAA